MEDTTTTLENQIELEKMEIPVPEKTLEAATAKAYAVARKLRASKSAQLSDFQIKKLSRIASQMRADILETGVVGVDNDEDFNLEVPADAQECAEEFECFGDECKEAVEQLEEQRVEAGEKILRIAQRVLATDRQISSRKLTASVKKILADATKLDLMRNLTNIENKSQKDQKLQTLADWDEVAKLSPGVNKMTQLKNLKVQDLKNIMVCLRGGKSTKDE